MRRCLLALALLALASCTPTAPTRADLEATLVQDGDLPAGWEAGQLSPPGDDARQIVASRELRGPVGQVGFVGVTLHPSTGAAEGGYAALLAGLDLDEGEPVELGEQSTLRAATVAWRRCRASAALSLPGEDRDAVLAYAQRLDARLQTLAC